MNKFFCEVDGSVYQTAANNEAEAMKIAKCCKALSFLFGETEYRLFDGRYRKVEQ